jgi:hypothetical protein
MKDLASLAVRFGRHEFYGPDSPEDPVDVHRDVTAVLWPEAEADPAAFAHRLRLEVLPAGGWAPYGADRLLADLTPAATRHSPDGLAVLDASLAFMREHGVPPKLVRPYQWDRWVARGGTIDAWLPQRPAPDPDEVELRPLAPGVIRPVARLLPTPDSNVILVQQRDDGSVALLVDAPRSGEDPRRRTWEWKVADSLYAAYLAVGFTHQTPTAWFDPELEPFFPLPPCALLGQP